MLIRGVIALVCLAAASFGVGWLGHIGLRDGWFERMDSWMPSADLAPSALRVFEGVATAASMKGVLVGVGIMVVLLILRRRFTDIWLILGAAATAAVAQSLLKDWVGRPRPEGYALAETGAFPSGQALIAVAVYGLFGLLLMRSFTSRRLQLVVGTLTLLFVAAITYGRLAVGAHYVSDVLSGIVLGLVWIAVGWWLSRPKQGMHHATLATNLRYLR